MWLQICTINTYYRLDSYAYAYAQIHAVKISSLGVGELFIFPDKIRIISFLPICLAHLPSPLMWRLTENSQIPWLCSSNVRLLLAHFHLYLRKPKLPNFNGWIIVKSCGIFNPRPHYGCSHESIHLARITLFCLPSISKLRCYAWWPIESKQWQRKATLSNKLATHHLYGNAMLVGCAHMHFLAITYNSFTVYLDSESVSINNKQRSSIYGVD